LWDGSWRLYRDLAAEHDRSWIRPTMASRHDSMLPVGHMMLTNVNMP